MAALPPILKDDNGPLIRALVDWLVPPTLDFVQRQVKVSQLIIIIIVIYMYMYMYSLVLICHDEL